MTGQVVKCKNCGAPLLFGAKFCSECGHQNDVAPPPVPQQLQTSLGPDYQVMGELGRGGFALVYSVRDIPGERYIAVKVMRPELMTSTIAIERFRREANYVAGLDHPNILSVVFTSHTDHLVYYGMPRVNGKPLGEIRRQLGVFNLSGANRVLADVARGLQHAHDRSFIHRDIKPSNIMIDQDGKAIILDFGIAKALGGDLGRLTFTGQAIGTPDYMSPEQCAGNKDIDARTDMYSWAVLAFELLTGAPPFVGNTARDTMNLHIAAPVPNLRVGRPDAPAGLCFAIAQCLAKDPNDRFGSVTEAASAAGIPL